MLGLDAAAARVAVGTLDVLGSIDLLRSLTALNRLTVARLLRALSALDRLTVARLLRPLTAGEVLPAPMARSSGSAPVRRRGRSERRSGRSQRLLCIWLFIEEDGLLLLRHLPRSGSLGYTGLIVIICCLIEV